ncbi:hypothetical protein AHAS_Ahas06G0177900 [Arachis hypogaea]
MGLTTDNINATKLIWNLVVGVVCLYKIPSSWNSTDVCSLELVLQNEKGDRIHCSIPKQTWWSLRQLFMSLEFTQWEISLFNQIRMV